MNNVMCYTGTPVLYLNTSHLGSVGEMYRYPVAVRLLIVVLIDNVYNCGMITEHSNT